MTQFLGFLQRGIVVGRALFGWRLFRCVHAPSLAPRFLHLDVLCDIPTFAPFDREATSSLCGPAPHSVYQLVRCSIFPSVGNTPSNGKGGSILREKLSTPLPPHPPGLAWPGPARARERSQRRSAELQCDSPGPRPIPPSAEAGLVLGAAACWQRLARVVVRG